MALITQEAKSMKEIALVDPEDFAPVILERARFYGVTSHIHREDFIFQFLMSNESFGRKEDAVNYYFMDADNSCKKLLKLISIFLNDSTPEHDISILEFASGYGCVTRHLAEQQRYVVTPCDIHPAAVAFISDKMGLKALLSTHKPEDLIINESFDVTFALSFFSHMPDATWLRWLATLLRTVRPGGLLIFTTHGRTSAKHFGEPALNHEGYWFKAESEQKDIDISEYGQTIVTPGYVFKKISALPDAWPCFYQQAFWWDHQDTFVIRKAG